MKVATYSLLLLFIFFLKVGSAQDGRIDPTFGQEGVIIPDIPTVSRSYATSILQRPDGRIIVAGNAIFGPATPDNAYDIVLLQYREDGTPDPDFGDGGLVRTEISPYSDITTKSLLLEDGRLLVTGNYTSKQEEFGDPDRDVFLASYLPDGQLDTTFGNAGITTISISSGTDFPYGIARQEDGRLLLGGSYFGRNAYPFLVRLLQDGTPDLEFGGGGYRIYHKELNGAGIHIRSMLIQPDRKIVLLGSQGGTGNRILLMRFSADGQVDSTFADQGLLYFQPEQNGAYASEMLGQADGRIIVGMYFHQPGVDADQQTLALIRFNYNGSLNTSFGTGGIKYLTLPGTQLHLDAMDQQADGKFLLSGEYQPLGQEYSDIFLLRLLPDGSRDPSFGANGLVVHSVGLYIEYSHMISQQSDGKILATGKYNLSGDISDYKIFLARFDNQKTVDAPEPSLPETSFEVFPNPVIQNISMKYKLETSERISISLSDINGRMIHSFLQNEYLSAGEQQHSFLLPKGLAAGTYLLNWQSDQGEAFSKKIIVQK
ncbi:MAG: T9SS type A sorting domain-containing protein [Saprospiraceae bacterium]